MKGTLLMSAPLYTNISHKEPSELTNFSLDALTRFWAIVGGVVLLPAQVGAGHRKCQFPYRRLGGTRMFTVGVRTDRKLCSHHDLHPYWDPVRVPRFTEMWVESGQG